MRGWRFGLTRTSERRVWARATVVAGLLAMCATTTDAAAGTLCALPASFRVSVEERGLVDRGGPGVVAVSPSPSGLESGDVIRQANGARIAGCHDLERSAAEAAAKGLVLLLAVERGGQILGVAATMADIDTEVAARAATPAAPHAGVSSNGTAAPVAPPNAAAGTLAAARVAATPVPAVTPRPRRAATMPLHDGTSADLRRRAAAAAAALARVDEVAQPGVPLAVYERRLGDAGAAIAALDFDVGAADSAVRDFVEDTIALHRTARDIRRAQLAFLSQSGIDRRAPMASTLPYFSDSRVPEWVGAYPFLQETILTAPHESSMPLPGEVAGRWDPERALALLWERASTARATLATWAEAT